MDGVILAAGKGVRLQPLTHWLPKFMVPVGAVPVVVHVVDRLRLQGCDRLVLVVSSTGLSFVPELRKFLPVDLNLEVVLCDEAGQGPALRRGASLTDSEQVWVAFCDNVFEPGEVINVGDSPRFFVVVDDARMADTGSYGVVGLSPRISKSHAGKGQRIQTGLFCLPRTECLSMGSDIVMDYVNQRSDVDEVLFSGWWRDVGGWDMWLECEQLLRGHNG